MNEIKQLLSVQLAGFIDNYNCAILQILALQTFCHGLRRS
jgi:hypothetical protein